jgi:polyhydroxyalkanoate synthesis regulator phasin
VETAVATERSPHPFRLPPRRPAPTRRSASADDSAAELVLMAEPDSNGSVRDLLERIALATVGAAALTAERADALADELADRGMVRRDEARALIEEVSARWRGDATRLGEKAGTTLDRLFHELGLVTKDDVEELELRIAQLEHRLRLLEDPAERGSAP